MVEIQMNYEGELRCVASHGPSGVQLITDAPVDNMGKGASFSPTDLVATALATCIATTMAIVAQRKEIDLRGMKVRVEKHMSSDAPRRIARLPLQVEVPLPGSHPERALLEAAAKGCPVARSLAPEVEKEIHFTWLA
jgi:putative redox protein